MGTQSISTSDVRVIERIAALLDGITDQESCSLTELAEACSLPVSTTSRLLESLDRVGLVHRNPLTKRYHLGWKLFRMASACKPSKDIAAAIHPILEWLSKETSEDTALAVLQGFQAVIIDFVESDSPLKIIYKINRPEALYFGAFRKTLLAYQPEEWIESYIRELRFDKFTETTITSAAALRRELSLIREQGYATSFGEKIAESVGFAAPVFDYSGQMRAVIQIVVPEFRINKRTVMRYIQPVVRAAEQATSLLGGKQPQRIAR